MFQLVLCLVLFLTAMFLADSVSAATSIAPSIGGTCRTKADCPLTDPASDCYCLSTQSKDGKTCEDAKGKATGACIGGRTLNPNPTAQDITTTFRPPTGTANFADLICRVTGFISNTILPPVAVMMMLVVGFLFLTSGGAPQRAGVAQKALLFTIAGVALLVLAPGIVVLIGDLFGNTALTTAPVCQSVTTGTIVDALLKTVNWLSWFVALTSVAMGLYSGFLYITARDNPQQVQQAAKVLSYVIIGIAVAILAFSIVTITKQLMGL